MYILMNFRIFLFVNKKQKTERPKLYQTRYVSKIGCEWDSNQKHLRQPQTVLWIDVAAILEC